MSNEIQVPEYLYRGMCIRYEDLKNFVFSGVDMELPYDPYINEQGKETVRDGNEYGIYMSDNPQMVIDSYGNPTRKGSGTYIEPFVGIGGRGDRIKIPDIGVCYKISTKGIDVREPWIQKELQGGNNGYSGKEWITDKIPMENYDIMQVMIGQDMIHDEEYIEIDNPEYIKEKVIEILEKRKERLEIFAQEMSKIPEARRREFSIEDFDVFKEIYGKDGFRYMQNFEDIDTSSDSGMIRYLMAKVYEGDRENIDFKTLRSLEQIQARINIYQKKGKSINVRDLITKYIKDNEKLIGLMDEKEGKLEMEVKRVNITDFYKKYEIGKDDDWKTIKSKLSRESKKWMKRQSSTNDAQELEHINEELAAIDEALEIFDPKNGKREEYDASLKEQMETEQQSASQRTVQASLPKGSIKIQDAIENAIKSGIPQGKIKKADQVEYEESQRNELKGITKDEQ